MKWFANNGDKVLAFLTAVFALAVTQHIGPPAAEEWLTFSGGVLTLAHTVFFPNGATTPAVQVKVPPTPKQGGSARVSVLVMLAAVAAAVTGCALLTNPTFDAVLQAVVYEVIGSLLDKNPAIAPVVSQDAATLAALVSGNTTTTVAALQQQADTVISNSSLSVSDKAAFESLTAGVVALLGEEATAIPANAQAGLVLFFDDVQNAANLYPSAPASIAFRRNLAKVNISSDVNQDILNAANGFGK